MKLTTWNIRAIGNIRKQRNLSTRIKEEKPDMVFIQETKCLMDNIREIHNKWLIKYDYLDVKAKKLEGGFSRCGIHRNLESWMLRHLGTIFLWFVNL